MTDINPIAYCLYYKGEEHNPFEEIAEECEKYHLDVSLLHIAAMFWSYERIWHEEMLQGGEKLQRCVEDYYRTGLEDFNIKDRIPLELKALLYNRFMHWQEAGVEDFKKWYKEQYLETIRKIYYPLPPIPASYRPSTKEVAHYIAKWNSLENYVNQEHALDRLFFELCPENKRIEDILVKCAALNDFYSTNIFDIHSVAQHILALDIDERLESGDLTLVNDISLCRVGYNHELHFFYSFATKYCSHHKPESYAIFDNYVEKILLYFQHRDHFGHFRRTNLRDYKVYMQAIQDFRIFYGLEKYTIKQLDQYLWQLGKHHFMKRKYRA